MGYNDVRRISGLRILRSLSFVEGLTTCSLESERFVGKCNQDARRDVQRKVIEHVISCVYLLLRCNMLKKGNSIAVFSLYRRSSVRVRRTVILGYLYSSKAQRFETAVLFCSAKAECRLRFWGIYRSEGQSKPLAYLDHPGSSFSA